MTSQQSSLASSRSVWTLRLLVALIVAASVSCGGGGERTSTPTDPGIRPTVIRVGASGAGCEAYTAYPIRMTAQSVSTAYRTNEFSLRGNGPTVDVALPYGGAYRFSGWYGSDLLHVTARWDFTVNIVDQTVTPVALGCS